MSAWEQLRQVWAAFGCEQNPNDFRPEVRQQMWEQIVSMAEEATDRHNRIYRENQQLAAEIQRLRTPRASRTEGEQKGEQE